MSALALVACKGGPGTKVVFPSLSVSLDLDGGASLSVGELLDGGIDFGTVPVLILAKRTLLIGNTGGTDLTVQAVTLLPDGGAFSMLAAPPTTVTPGGSIPLPLGFIAQAQQDYQGSLTLQTDDQQNPTLTFALTGRGSTQVKLEVSPDPIDFGAVGEGTTQYETVTLQSTGTAALLVLSIALSSGTDPAFGIVSAVPSPDGGGTLIDAGSSVQIALQFKPVAGTPIFPDGGALLIQSTDPDHQPFSVPLVAQMIAAPVPLIGDPGTVPVGATVTLDGGASYDPGGLYPLTYAWQLTKKPGGSQAQLSDVTIPFPQMVADQPGRYDFALSVTNDAGVQSLGVATASLYAKPLQDIYIELVWAPTGAPATQSLVDLDLHFMSPGAWLNGAYDCYWANNTPQMNGYGGSFLALCSEDQIVGPGPEWAEYSNPTPGTYSVGVVYYSTHGQTMVNTDATVRIYIYGIIEYEQTRTLSTVGDIWWAANINWPWLADGGISIVDVVNDAGRPPPVTTP
jgi:hypothetical protein